MYFIHENEKLKYYEMLLRTYFEKYSTVVFFAFGNLFIDWGTLCACKCIQENPMIIASPPHVSKQLVEKEIERAVIFHIISCVGFHLVFI